MNVQRVHFLLDQRDGAAHLIHSLHFPDSVLVFPLKSATKKQESVSHVRETRFMMKKNKSVPALPTSRISTKLDGVHADLLPIGMQS